MCVKVQWVRLARGSWHRGMSAHVRVALRQWWWQIQSSTTKMEQALAVEQLERARGQSEVELVEMALVLGRGDLYCTAHFCTRPLWRMPKTQLQARVSHQAKPKSNAPSAGQSDSRIQMADWSVAMQIENGEMQLAEDYYNYYAVGSCRWGMVLVLVNGIEQDQGIRTYTVVVGVSSQFVQ